jgi:hypothetical protein
VSDEKVTHFFIVYDVWVVRMIRHSGRPRAVASAVTGDYKAKHQGRELKGQAF